jgi:DIS3-like exonuclease 1
MASPCTICDAAPNRVADTSIRRAVRGDSAFWLVPGVTCCVYFGELLERLPSRVDVVLLQSVLARVADSSPAAARRLRSWSRDPQHHCGILLNDCNVELALQTSGDNSVDRVSEAQLALRRLVHAAAWLADHGVRNDAPVDADDNDAVRPESRRILVVSESDEVLALARDFGVDACSVADLVKLLWPLDQVVQELYASLAESHAAVLRRKESPAAGGDVGASIFPAHWADDVLQAGVAGGRCKRGALRVNARFADHEASISADDGASSRIFVFGWTDRNRALHGDTVAVELLPRAQWKARPTRSQIAALADKESSWPAPANADDAVPTGRVVGIFERAHADIVGTLRAPDGGGGGGGGGGAVFVVPLLRELPLLRLPSTRTLPPDGVSQRVLVRFDEWAASRRFPDCHIVRRIGDAGSLDVELEALLAAHGIDSRALSPIPPAMLPPCLGPAPFGGSHWRLPELRLLSAATSFHDVATGRTPAPGSAPPRYDLRGIRAMSVDPPNCVDIDDALSFTSGAEWRRLVAAMPVRSSHPLFADVRDDDQIVGVHIADVAYFVHENSLPDLEARARGTTVYLPDRRFNMNPVELSEDLCSLRGDTERFVQTVLVRFRAGERSSDDDDDDERGAVAAPPGLSACAWFGRALIRSRHALAYEEAQRLHDANDRSNVTAQDLRELTLITRKLRQVRIDNGALELDSVEPHFTLDAATGAPIAVDDALDIEMKRVIAELMIMANCLVAQRIHETLPQSALLRNHAPPTEGAVAAFRELAAARGVDINADSNRAFAASLDAAVQRFGNAAEFALALRSEAARALCEATYVSSGAAPMLTHYGLAVDLYTHFTSPIRRYADLVVQRQLWYCLCVEEQQQQQQHQMLQPLTSPFVSFAIVDMCEDLNRFTRGSREVQRDSGELFLALYFARFPQDVLALIKEVRDDSCVCFLPRFGIETVVHFSDPDGKPLPVERGFGPSSLAVKRIECDAKAQRVILTVAGTAAPQQTTIELRPFDALDVFVDADANVKYRVPPPRAHLRAFRAPRVASDVAPQVRDVSMPRSGKALRSAAAALQNAESVASDVVSEDSLATTTYSLLQSLLVSSADAPPEPPRGRGGTSHAVRLWKEQKNARQAFDRVRDELTPSLADEMGDGGLLDNVAADNAKRYAAHGMAVEDDLRRTKQQHFNERKASRFRKKAKENK